MGDGSTTRKKGWFSRNHQTQEAHLEAREKWQSQHSKEAKRRDVAERQAERDKRSPREQLTVLNQRLGMGKGAIKERIRLLKKIYSI